jgi:hypothetical protein
MSQKWDFPLYFSDKNLVHLLNSPMRSTSPTHIISLICITLWYFLKGTYKLLSSLLRNFLRLPDILGLFSNLFSTIPHEANTGQITHNRNNSSGMLRF